MKTIEVRRHAPADKEKDVSPEGLELAHQARDDLRETYSAHYCSPQKRTAQTMEAFGFEGATPREEFDVLPGDRMKPHMPHVHAFCAEQRCDLIEGMLALDDTRGILEEVAGRFVEGLKQVASELPDDGAALVVSHGGAIEPAVMLSRDDWTLSAMGGALKECEAAIFSVEGDAILGVEIVRRLGG